MRAVRHPPHPRDFTQRQQASPFTARYGTVQTNVWPVTPNLAS